MTDAVAALRAFNRFHTRFSGVLQPSYMDSGLGVTAARILYEIAQQEGILASLLCERLDVDRGYVSRLLRDFEKKGWIVRSRGKDGRSRPVRLTRCGSDVFSQLDARTRDDTEERIAGLDDKARARLVSLLSELQEILAQKSDAMVP